MAQRDPWSRHSSSMDLLSKRSSSWKKHLLGLEVLIWPRLRHLNQKSKTSYPSWQRRLCERANAQEIGTSCDGTTTNNSCTLSQRKWKTSWWNLAKLVPALIPTNRSLSPSYSSQMNASSGRLNPADHQHVENGLTLRAAPTLFVKRARSTGRV